MLYQKTFYTTLGYITIFEQNNAIVKLEIKKNHEASIIQNETPLLKETEKEIKEYLQGDRKKFELPLNPKGTEFQIKVWKQLQLIPYGNLVTYKDIAIKIGNSKASRAVGMANHNNPIPIIIPCHRVIGQNNKLIGYAFGLEMKQFLINLEKSLDKSKKIV